MSKVTTTYLTPDGRRAEKQVEVIPGNDGEEKVVQEIFEEEKLPKSLKKRIIETKRPVIVEREIQEIDNEQVVKTERESIKPDVKMELREIIQFKNKDAELSMACNLTKQDVEEVVKAALEESPRVSRYQVAVESETETKKVNLWNAAGIVAIIAMVAIIGWLLLV